MHSVNLRNMLTCRRRTKREEQGDESDEFKELFDYNLTYIDGMCHKLYCVLVLILYIYIYCMFIVNMNRIISTDCTCALFLVHVQYSYMYMYTTV